MDITERESKAGNPWYTGSLQHEIRVDGKFIKEYIDITAFSVVGKSLSSVEKGTAVSVRGPLVQTSYQNKAGETVSKIKITVDGWDYLPSTYKADATAATSGDKEETAAPTVEAKKDPFATS